MRHAFGSGTVTTCLNDLYVLGLGINHPTFCLQDESFKRPRHRRSSGEEDENVINIGQISILKAHLSVRFGWNNKLNWNSDKNKSKEGFNVHLYFP